MSKTLPIHWLQYAGNVVFFFWRERRRIAFGFVLTLLTWAISVGPNFTRAICYAVNVNNDAYSNITSGFVARNYLMFSFGFGFAKWLANNVIVFCAKFPKFLVVHMKPTKRTTRAHARSSFRQNSFATEQCNWVGNIRIVEYGNFFFLSSTYM